MNKKKPLVSIVIINYNGIKYLKRTIEPILKLNYSNLEFIIVDNGSSDNSLNLIKKYKKIKLIKSPKLREKNFACNLGISKSKGEFILLLDNDALITNKNILDELIQRYNEKTGSISLSFYNENEVKSKSYGGYFGYYFIKENKEILIKNLIKYDGTEIGFPSGMALFISKKKWKQTGGYDDNLKFGGDDNDLGIKLILLGYKNYLYTKTLQVHLGVSERIDTTKYSLKWKEMFYAHLYTIFKNYKIINMIFTLILYTIFGFLKSIKQTINRLDFRPFFAFFQGYFLFLKNIPIAIKERKKIQNKRIVRNDIFLKIKPKKYN